jgi:hypothetical protein
MKTVTIDLSETLYFPSQFGQRAIDDSFSIGLNTADISTPTAFNLEFSHNKTDWYQGVNPADDTDLEFTLTDKFFRAFRVDPGVYWRLVFDSGSTGTITGTINDD